MAEKLAAALAELQQSLPPIHKGETATVKTKDGDKYSYTYANLTDISATILPLLGKLGLSFIAKPTFTEDGRFVLAYSLLHESGEREDGAYPLPTQGTPQQVGSAITYGRRYCLCAVTGIAPDDDDDDGQAASAAHAQYTAPPSATAVAWRKWRDAGLTPDAAVMADAFAAWSEGVVMKTAPDDQVRAFTKAIDEGAFVEHTADDRAPAEGAGQ